MRRDLDPQLRARLARLDPVPADHPVDRVTSPQARQLLERIMQTTENSTTPAVPSSRRRRPVLLASAALAVAVVAVGTVLVVQGGTDGKQGPGTSAAPKTTLELSVPGGPSMSSCLPFDVKFLRDMPVAFAGTVTSAAPGKATFDVDRWYKGGDADEVTASTPDAQGAVSIETVTFEQGKRYLVTATNDTINGCGYTGLATPQLEQSFNEAFGS